MSELNSRFWDKIGNGDWLVAEQVAACLEFARDRVCLLCAANDFPLLVEVREGRAQVAVQEFARFVADESESVQVSAGAAPGSLVLARLFQAELRAEIYRLEVIRAVQALRRFVDELAADPKVVEERCRFQLEMAKNVLNAQAGAVAAGLVQMVSSTVGPERPLAAAAEPH